MAIVDETGVAIRADFTKFGPDVTRGAKSASTEFARTFESSLPKTDVAKSLPDESQGRAAGSRTGRGFSSGFTGSLRNITQYASGFLIGNAVIGAVGRTFSAVKGAIFDFNSQLQNATIAFTTMLGSGRKARVFLGELQQFAKVTPFDFPGLVTASQQLLAYGFSAKSVIPTLTAIGDASAGLSLGAEGVQRLTTAIGQIQAKGKVQSDELLQLTEAGVPALKILANGMGVSTSALQKMISKGLVPANKAIPLLLGGLENGTKGAAGQTAKFGGLMEQQSRTFTGALSNIGDALNQTIGGAFKPFFNLASSGLLGLANLLQGPAFKSFGASIAAGITTAIRVVRGFGPIVRSVFAALSPIIANLATFFTQSLVPAVRDLIVTFGPLIQGIAKLAIASWVIQWRALSSILANQVGPALTAITGFLRDHAVAVQAVVVAVLAGVAAFKAFSAVTALIGMVKNVAAAIRLMTVAVKALNLAEIENPTLLIVVALVALAAGLIYAYKHSETFRAVVQSVMAAVVTAFHAVVGAGQAVVSALVTAWNAVAGATTTAFGAVVGAFAAVVNAIKSALSVIGTVMATIVTVITFPARLALALLLAIVFAGFNALRAPIDAALGAIRAVISAAFSFYARVVQTQMAIILAVVHAVWGAVSAAISAVMGVITAIVSAGWRGLVAVITAVAGALSAAARAVFGRVKDAVSSALSALGGLVSKPFNAAVSAISGFGTKIFNAAKTVFGRAKDGITAGIGDMASVAGDLVTGFINGLAGLGGKLYSSVMKFIKDNVPGPVLKVLGIGSPSKLFAQYGAWTGQGFEQGILSQVKPVASASKLLARAASGTTSQQLRFSSSSPAVGARTGTTAGFAAAGSSPALWIENYHAAPDSNPYRTAEDLALIARSRGGSIGATP